jgi:pre-mRNA-processing factor 19
MDRRSCQNMWCANNGLYSVHDLRSAQQLYVSPKAEHGFESLTFHPDGALPGAGSAAGTVLMYDIRARELVTELGGGDADAVKFGIHALGFSENGYQLLAPSSESTVAVWDLRNQKAVHTFDLGAGFGVLGVGYDPNAKLLGISGTGGLRVFAHKTWEQIVSFEEGGAVADFAWGGLGKVRLDERCGSGVLLLELVPMWCLSCAKCICCVCESPTLSVLIP